MSRMQVLITVILCSILGASVGVAQGVYLTANAGYGFGSGTQLLGTAADVTQTSTSYEGNYGSYGEGFKFGASAGYMFSRNLGAELGFSYWLGNTFEWQNKFLGGVSTTKWTGSGFVSVPSVVLSAGMETVNPYARFGLVIGVLEVKLEYKVQSTLQTADIIQEQTGNLAFGYAGALGLLIPAGSAVGFFVEADINSVTYSPKQIEYTKYIVNGVDRLPSLEHKVYEYKESYKSNEEAVSMATRSPFSSIGAVVGVKVNL